MKVGGLEVSPLTPLLLMVPAALVMDWLHVGPAWLFAASALAIVPLAGLMGEATEHLADRLGAGLGGILNATFGNAAELIIAIIALHRGLNDVVKASITGSILGNIMLVGGLAVLAGGVRYERQRFNATAAGLGATMLALSVIGLMVPAIFYRLVPAHEALPQERKLSLAIAMVLFVTYVLSLVFSLKTHRHLYSGSHIPDIDESDDAWSPRRSMLVLVAATAGVAVMSEVLVGSVEQAADQLGLSHIFVGVILVAIVGNAAEHSTAVLMALKNKMDLSLHIAVGSSIQVALLIAPLLIFLSYAIGHEPLDLLFSPMEVAAIGLSVGVFALVGLDGESHWMEGVLLIAVYVILGIAFFFMP